MTGNQTCAIFPIESEKERRRLVDRNNHDSPWYNFIGNDAAIETLSDIAYAALSSVCYIDGEPVTAHSFVTEKENGKIAKPQIALIGPAGCGKTTLAKSLAKIVDLPSVITVANQIKNAEALFDLMKQACEYQPDTILESQQIGGITRYEMPPMIVFIDEVDGLSGKVINALLTATEPNDAMLRLNKDVEIDCREVLWVISTTERGKLFRPFETRFLKVKCNPYTQVQVAKIIKNNYPRWSISSCARVAKYVSNNPREAIAFADKVDLLIQRQDLKVDDAIELSARRDGISKLGLTREGIAVLLALKINSKGLSLIQLAEQARVEVEELQRFILPPLFANGSIIVTNRHRITENGLKLLNKH